MTAARLREQRSRRGNIGVMGGVDGAPRRGGPGLGGQQKGGREAAFSRRTVGIVTAGTLLDATASSKDKLASDVELRLFDAAGAEIDLVLTLRGHAKPIAIEVKHSATPKPSRGFWTAREDLGIEQAFVIHPGKNDYPLERGVTAWPVSRIAALPV